MRYFLFVAFAYVAAFFSAPAAAQADDVAPQCGHFAPAIQQPIPNNENSPFRHVHYYAKFCNQIMIDGTLETIPPGVGVISGGVMADVFNACIDKTCGQPLAASTLYRVYVFMDGATMKMDFSTGGHKEDPDYGNEVHVSDPARSLVGMIYTNAQGRIDGNTYRQMTLSWFNRGHTGLAVFLNWGGGPMPYTCSNTLVAVSPALEFLTFATNDTFKQAFTMPNIEVSGTVQSEKIGGYVHVAVGISHANLAPGWHPFSHLASHYQTNAADAGTVHSVAIGAGGAEEGLVKAVVMMSNGGGGGCVLMPSGTLYVDLDS